MQQSILGIPNQFKWEPDLSTLGEIKKYDSYVVAGMGGSHLGADLFRSLYPHIPIRVYSDYRGMIDKWFDRSGNTLLICDSYSGNTEETLDVAAWAISEGVPLVIITARGKLLNLAKVNDIPYIQLIDDGTQPRMTNPQSLIAMASIIDVSILPELREMADLLDSEKLKEEAKKIETQIEGIPVFYASGRNFALALIWKIYLNETAKQPAFLNIFPELNHNEMQGMDISVETFPESKALDIVFLYDDMDYERIQKRMKITQNIYEEKGLRTISVDLEGKNHLERIMSSLIMAAWVGVIKAEKAGKDPELVMMVEDFKERLD